MRSNTNLQLGCVHIDIVIVVAVVGRHVGSQRTAVESKAYLKRLLNVDDEEERLNRSIGGPAHDAWR